MFRKLLIFVVACYSLSTVAAPAGDTSEKSDDATVRDFKKMALVIPRALVAKQITQFGRLNISNLLKKIPLVDVRSTGWFYRVQQSTPSIDEEPMARSTAKWWVDAAGGHIRVNRQMWLSASSSVRAVIAFHEHLGVAGYDDHDYFLSSSLWTLAQKEADGLGADKKALTDEIQVVAELGGGIAGVGGGGDISGVTDRLQMLKVDLNHLNQAGSEESRASAAEGLFSDFRIQGESRWRTDKTKSNGFTSAPAGKFQEMELLKGCQEIVKGKRDFQQMCYDAIIKDSPDLAARLPDVPSLVTACHGLIAKELGPSAGQR